MEQEQIKEMSKELNKLREKVENLNSLVEQLVFPKNIEEAWREYDKGEIIEVERDNLKKELKKW